MCVRIHKAPFFSYALHTIISVSAKPIVPDLHAANYCAARDMIIHWKHIIAVILAWLGNLSEASKQRLWLHMEF